MKKGLFSSADIGSEGLYLELRALTSRTSEPPKTLLSLLMYYQMPGLCFLLAHVLDKRKVVASTFEEVPSVSSFLAEVK